MKLSEIITLLGAGYTRAEIDAMAADEAPTAPPEAPKPDTPPAAPPEAQQTPPQAPQAAPPDNGNKELLDAIQKLTAAVQVRNAQTVPQPAEAATDVNAEAEKVLLNLYNT